MAGGTRACFKYLRQIGHNFHIDSLDIIMLKSLFRFILRFFYLTIFMMFIIYLPDLTSSGSDRVK